MVFSTSKAKKLFERNFTLHIFTVFVILFISLGGGQASYKVAIFEHHPVEEATPEETILKNVEIYRNQVEKAIDMGVDLIIFPEYGLTTIEADPKTHAVPISNSNKVIKEIENMAAEHEMYIVVNLLEKSEEDDNNNIKYYNTNLVFSPNGTIIAKYRKINLLSQEKEKNLTPGDNKPVTFRTQFGVTFGMFTEFDIFFKNPAIDILNDSKITDIIYPTAWKSYMPFQTSLSIQNGYSITNDVNLLAAGYNYPEHGYESDIFPIYRDTKVYYLEDSPNSRLIVRDLKRRARRRRTKRHHERAIFPEKQTDIFIPDRKFEAEKYNFTQIDFSQSKYEVQHRDFRCTFDLSVSEPSSPEIYKIMIYDGVEELGDVKSHVRICTILACANNTNESCGTRINSNIHFTHIKVSSFLENNVTTVYTPVTLTHDLQPIKDCSYDDYHSTHSLTILRPQNNVLVFGIMGRVDDKNAKIVAENSSNNFGKKIIANSSHNLEGLHLILLLLLCLCLKL